MLLFSALALLGACGEETRLAIHLALPVSAELDPLKGCQPGGGCEGLDPRLARFTMRLEHDDGSVVEQRVRVDEDDLELGRIPLARPFDLRVSAETATGQILGLGIAQDIMLEDEPLVLSLTFRKPIVFIGTAGGLDVFDAAASGSTEAKLPPIPLEKIDAVASAPSGAFVASATATRIVIHRTLDHQPSLEIPLTQTAHRLRISPNGRHLFVMQRDQLAAVDLLSESPQLLGRGVGGTPSEIAFDDDGTHAWLLVDGIDHQVSCQGAAKSKLVRLRYGGPQDDTGVSFTPLDGLALDFAAADMLLHAASKRLLVARPCEGEVVSLAANANAAPAPQQLASLQNAFDIALVDDSLVVVTKDTLPGSAGGQALRIPLDGSEKRVSSLFAIPPIAMPVGTGPTSVGRFSWISEPSDDLLVHEVEIAPDGERALLFYRTRFVSNLEPSPGCLLALDAIGKGYMVIDLVTGAPLVNQLTRLEFQTCTGQCISIGGQSMADKAVCEAAFRSALKGQGALSSQSFEPRAATLLFGGY